AKEEPPKAEEKPESKSLLDKLSDLEWKDVQNYFSDVFSGDSKDKPKATDDSLSLPDGTKVAADGSWVQLSPEAQKLAGEAGADKPVVHKYKDKDGKEVSLEIHERRAFHLA